MTPNWQFDTFLIKTLCKSKLSSQKKRTLSLSAAHTHRKRYYVLRPPGCGMGIAGYIKDVFRYGQNTRFWLLQLRGDLFNNRNNNTQNLWKTLRKCIFSHVKETETKLRAGVIFLFAMPLVKIYQIHALFWDCSVICEKWPTSNNLKIKIWPHIRKIFMWL